MAEPRTVRENANTLSSVQIAEILPHRYPFALVDRVLDYEPGQWAIGRKCVTRNEEFFNGHFPAQPVMPGVLLLEALAQPGAVAAFWQRQGLRPGQPYLAFCVANDSSLDLRRQMAALAAASRAPFSAAAMVQEHLYLLLQCPEAAAEGGLGDVALLRRM